jgi:hypothetical protein
MAKTSPTTTAAAPPAMNQMERSVGLPVKVREMSELSEWDSLKPKMRRIIPRAKIAKPMMLFIENDPFNNSIHHWGAYPKAIYYLPQRAGTFSDPGCAGGGSKLTRLVTSAATSLADYPLADWSFGDTLRGNFA